MNVKPAPKCIDVRECGVTSGFYTRALVAEVMTVKAEYERMGCTVQLRGVIRNNMQILQLAVFEG